MQVRTIFKDAVDVDGVLVGAYPMHDEVRSVFRAETSVSYDKSAHCTREQEAKGGGFFIEVGTSFAEPEVIDSLYFYNSIPDVHEFEQYKDKETGKMVCGEYFSSSKMDIVPMFCENDKK